MTENNIVRNMFSQILL